MRSEAAQTKAMTKTPYEDKAALGRFIVNCIFSNSKTLSRKRLMLFHQAKVSQDGVSGWDHEQHQ